MSCRPLSTTTRRQRGTTLIEMTVACTIFLAMTTVLFALLLQNRRSAQKVSSHTDTSAQMMLVFERVRAEMRTGRIIGLSGQGRQSHHEIHHTTEDSGAGQIASSPGRRTLYFR